MSLTLGQKLRQAREENGISVSEVAEQTRIAPLYIESIDNDDYRSLPGGIFNRGFVKSYAKYVGIDEQEALLDYARLLNDTEGNDVEEVKTYRPQVLTDDRMTSSMLPTLILAAVILGIMTGGVLFLLRYLRQPSTPGENIAANANIGSSNTNSATEIEPPVEQFPLTAPDMATLRVEFMAVDESVLLQATIDGRTTVVKVIPESAKLFEPKISLRLRYPTPQAQFARLMINGKPITVPITPLDPKQKGAIEFEINKDNLERIWTSGAISADLLTANPDANANIETTTRPTGSRAQSPRPAVSRTSLTRPPEPKAAKTPRPSATIKTAPTTKLPAANR
jgi:hypothetical protein